MDGAGADAAADLAWLRTSLSLASIGIAVTQLFRLSNATVGSNVAASSFDVQNLAVHLDALSDPPTREEIVAMFTQLFSQLAAASTSTPYDPLKYRYLGRPLGSSFIALGMLFLVLGTARYFKNQSSLMQNPSMFTPSRRAVIVSTFTIGAVVVGSFAAILGTK